jgi:outer membrane immunogenic protein
MLRLGHCFLVFGVAAPALAIGQAAQAQAPDRYAFEGRWVAVATGMDWSELPDKDGPEIMHGVEIGINRLRGRRMIGVEAEFGSSNARKEYSGYRVPGDSISVRYGRDIYAGIRPGLLVSNDLLAYGKAGYINSYVRYSYLGPAEHNRDFGRPGALDGFLVGGGVEYALGRRWLVKAEYRYANFHDGLYRHQAVAAFGIRF